MQSGDDVELSVATGGTPIAGCCIMENPAKMTKMDDFGTPCFRKPLCASIRFESRCCLVAVSLLD